MTTWIISDTHFGDNSLVGARPVPGKVTRPFETVSQMDDCLADLWNDHIAENDRVLHLGDVHAGRAGVSCRGCAGRSTSFLATTTTRWTTGCARPSLRSRSGT